MPWLRVMDSSQGLFVHAILDKEFKAAATGTATIKYFMPLTAGRVRIVTKLRSQERRKLFIDSVALNEGGQTVAALEEVWIALK